MNGVSKWCDSLSDDDRRGIDALRRGEPVSDDDFDLVYSGNIQRMSSAHWTPVAVAIRAANLLVTGPETRVLDVGCGAGKFCIVGALATAGSFFGIEQRDYLVEHAMSVIRHNNVPRAKIQHGNITEIDWSDFNAFYLFNPFYENIATFAQIDYLLPTGTDFFDFYVEFVRARLSEQPIGTRVVDYQGFGGVMPQCYSIYSQEFVSPRRRLSLWVKDR